MVTYVVVYSIIIFLLAALGIALAFVYSDRRTRRMQRKLEEALQIETGKKAFLRISSRGQTSFILADSVTHEIVYVSENIKSILGVTAKELYEDADCLRKTMDKSALRSFREEMTAWNKTGTFIFDFPYGKGNTARMEVIREQYRNRTYTFFVFYDVTQEVTTRKKMQSEIDEALRLASEKSSFLSNMSHEIRTPMNGIIGMMSIAKMNINDPERVEACLDKAGFLATFLVGMINDILDISKIESGRMLLYNTNFDIFQFADKISNMFQSTMQAKGINYKVETLDFTARILVGDELRLTQVITNFISNAQKFTPTGGSVTVTFKQLDIIDNHVQLLMRCRDTGKGIAPDAIHKIMKPFEQEDASTSHNYGGTGLGLALADNFVNLMGGNIVVDSELGKGSDFSVYLSLPIAEVEQDMSTPFAAQQGSVGAFNYEGCRILMAEDNEINAEIAIEILESEGAKVTLAHDGQECVDIFTNNPAYSFDLLLVDIQMPRLNGRDAARAIRASGKEDAKEVVMVALSADAFVEDVVKSKEAGMDGHVSKPIDFDHLKQTLGEIFASKKK